MRRRNPPSQRSHFFGGRIGSRRRSKSPAEDCASRGDDDTIAGLVAGMLGNIPEEDECPSVQIGALTITVEQVEEQRITRLRVENMEPIAGEA